ncbi:hypothetical protein K490DRAFT_59459 [Saccharata proteae CBS 121410]|uniref:Uncharacterized protein n=1 Tax=Saccharata proteae CBS 121410 TaxID=1314787 RepID=A0A9P4LSL8_9PEZI|nr:hypothetical protein K490DRAFT_59459 [Saccharata proteae CBS 121410]
MDDWGDPWADDAEKGGPETAATGLTGSAVLTGFGDEAHWGAEDEHAGWSTAAALSKEGHVEEKSAGLTSTQNAGDEGPGPSEEVVEEDVRISFEDRPLDEPHISDAAAEQQLPAVDLDSSDSGTTVEPDHASRTLSNPIASPETTPESVRSGVSTRPSTSLSESSHLEEASESVRTSFEDDHRPDKGLESVGDDVQSRDQSADDAAHNTKDEEDDFGDFEDEVLDDEDVVTEDAQGDSFGRDGADHVAVSPTSSKTAASPNTNTAVEGQSPKDYMLGSKVSFIPDVELISGVFSAPDALNGDLEEPGDIISSTSTRKAWYRITRKETMREFESGNDVDNHVRIGWRGSRIRAESNKIVSRWASEDRINGRVMLGGKPGAIFGWDNPTSTLPSSFVKHKRTATSSGNKQQQNRCTRPPES